MREKIREFIKSNFNVFSDDLDFADDENIFQKGFVDSLFALKLVNFLESEFSIRMRNEDLDIKNFQCVDSMVSFVEARLQEVGES